MSDAPRLLLYGASGYTGRLLVDAALEAGLRPTLCGRDLRRIEPLARAAGLPARTAPLDAPAAVLAALEGHTVVLNAAGPFSHTAEPLAEACVRRGAHYLDLCGEAEVLEQLARNGRRARTRGVMQMPGVGFDVVPSDCLARHVAQRLPAATHLRLGLSGLSHVSRGSAAAIAEQAGRPTRVRRAGALVSVAAGTLQRDFDFGAGETRCLAVTWGDLATAYRTTAIPNIETYFEHNPLLWAALASSRLLGPLWSAPGMQALLRKQTRYLPEGPSAEARAARRVVIVAEVEDAAGRRVRARLVTPEVYTMTAMTALAVAERVLAGDFEPGFQTPARVFGADFVLGLPGVSREDLS